MRPFVWPGGRAASHRATLRVAQPRARGRTRLSGRTLAGQNVSRHNNDVLELRASGLALKITEITRTDGDPGNPYDLWINCRVDIEVPGFYGTIGWSVLQPELQRFAEELLGLARALGSERELPFEPIESGVILRLRMNALGQISGEYHLRDSSHSPGAPELRGFFDMDQTFLFPLASAVKQLAAGKV